MDATPAVSYLESLERIAVDVIRPVAVEIDQTGAFPHAAMQALGKSGLLGLVSAQQAGGMGEGLRAAALVIERVAQECASTAMVLCMHYAGAAVIEAHGPLSVRQAIANGKHVTTLAFSEKGSRSQFWAPTSTAVAHNGTVHLDAAKGWVTSAGEADSYVWSSRPLAAEGASTLWLVPARTAGLSVAGAFNGLGLRGNASSPVNANHVAIERSAMLGPDGGGFDIMMSIVLPYFQIMNAAFSIGTMEAATRKAAEHVAGTTFEHTGSGLSDLPTIRAYLARMRIKTDMARALLLDTLDATEKGRADTMLRILEVKAAAGEASTEVTDLGMRVCGGAAFRKDVGVERHFRDARAATVMAPTTDVLYDFIGKALCGMPLF
ncbi:MAG TPA: acyl-CoA dehydrogenase family protein [Anaerolineales bacterium]|nr:acyl-CoA dehydrogenase family protein [Anaerolineales bacterium]